MCNASVIIIQIKFIKFKKKIIYIVGTKLLTMKFRHKIQNKNNLLWIICIIIILLLYQLLCKRAIYTIESKLRKVIIKIPIY